MLNKTFQTYHIIDIFSLLLHWHKFYIFIFIYFMLFHVPGMIIKMILINPALIFVVMFGVSKTFFRHLTRDFLIGPFPRLALHGPACHLLTCAPHSLPHQCTETGRDSCPLPLQVDTSHNASAMGAV